MQDSTVGELDPQQLARMHVHCILTHAASLTEIATTLLSEAERPGEFSMASRALEAVRVRVADLCTDEIPGTEAFDRALNDELSMTIFGEFMPVTFEDLELDGDKEGSE